MKYPIDECVEMNENKDKPKGLDDLAKELDDLLLGDFSAVNNGKQCYSPVDQSLSD